jgi:hypothetical protein
LYLFAVSYELKITMCIRNNISVRALITQKEERDQERGRKEQEKESMKRKRESDKEIRENLKQNVALNKETKKLNQKNSKETKEEFKKRRGAQSDKNKVRAQYRKDFSSELKRIRGDANVSVLQYFDEEENKEEQEEHIKHSVLPSTAHTAVTVAKGSAASDQIIAGETLMDELFKSLPSCDQSFFGIQSVEECSLEGDENKSKKAVVSSSDMGGIGMESKKESEVDWDDVFQTVNCLYAFNDYLQLQMPIKLDGLVERVSSVAAANPLNSNTQTQGDISTKAEDHSLIGHSASQDTNGVGSGAGAGAESTPISAVENMSPAGKVERSEEEEDEWDEEDDKTKKLRIKHNEHQTESSDDKEVGTGGGRNSSVGLQDAQADLDRIHLCLINSLTADLQSHLDLHESDKGCAVKFPLNQVCNARIRSISFRMLAQNHGNYLYTRCLEYRLLSVIFIALLSLDITKVCCIMLSSLLTSRRCAPLLLQLTDSNQYLLVVPPSLSTSLSTLYTAIITALQPLTLMTSPRHMHSHI